MRTAAHFCRELVYDQTNKMVWWVGVVDRCMLSLQKLHMRTRICFLLVIKCTHCAPQAPAVQEYISYRMYVHKIIHMRVLLVLMYPINVSVLWRWFLYELASIITTHERICMHAGI